MYLGFNGTDALERSKRPYFIKVPLSMVANKKIST